MMIVTYAVSTMILTPTADQNPINTLIKRLSSAISANYPCKISRTEHTMKSATQTISVKTKLKTIFLFRYRRTIPPMQVAVTPLIENRKKQGSSILTSSLILRQTIKQNAAVWQRAARHCSAMRVKSHLPRQRGLVTFYDVNDTDLVASSFITRLISVSSIAELFSALELALPLLIPLTSYSVFERSVISNS